MYFKLISFFALIIVISGDLKSNDLYVQPIRLDLRGIDLYNIWLNFLLKSDGLKWYLNIHFKHWICLTTATPTESPTMVSAGFCVLYVCRNVSLYRWAHIVSALFCYLMIRCPSRSCTEWSWVQTTTSTTTTVFSITWKIQHSVTVSLSTPSQWRVQCVQIICP